ncbi:MAG: BACON domain-containing protein [Bryobacteraceae bacterium]
MTPPSQSVPVNGGAFTIKIATSCTWTAIAGDPWIAVAQPTAATGSGSVSFTVGANPGTATRSGSIAIGSAIFPVSQAGAGCTIALASAGATVPATAQNGSFTVAVNAGCTIGALPDVPWIVAMVNGSTVAYSVSANPSGQSRSGNILVGSQKFTITQAGAACAFIVSPETIAIPASGGHGEDRYRHGRRLRLEPAEQDRFRGEHCPDFRNRIEFGHLQAYGSFPWAL